MTLALGRWRLTDPPDPAVTAALASALHIPPTLAALVAQRGYAAADDARTFLRPTLDQLTDPFAFRDMETAVHLVGEAVRAGTRILVHGDYDVDGQCAAALLTRVLRAAGADVVPFVPHRVRDGYDFGPAGLAVAQAHGVGLVITCDCGTTALETVAAAQAAGIRVLVTDHHLASVTAPADAMVNPQHPECGSPSKQLCGTGVAFKLVQALTGELGLPENLPYHFLELVALATVADVVPLTGENRVLVRFGLKALATSRWPGVRALVEAAGLSDTEFRAGHVGYVLAPRLNATGRIGDAMDGLRLLLTDDPAEAHVLAQQLEAQNAQRQAMDAVMLEEAVEDIERAVDLEREYGLVLARDGWHPGIIGLVASRLVERYARPTILVALVGDEGRGSGRSIARFDLHGALAACAPHLARFGGHRMAAGLTVHRDRLAAFREAFNEVARSALTVDDLVPTQRVDIVLSVDQLDGTLERLMRHLEPCGAGNPAPVLGIRSAAGRNARVVGTKHLRFTLEDDSGRIAAIGFGWADRVQDDWWSGPLDVAFRLERDEWRGVHSLKAKVVHLRPTG